MPIAKFKRHGNQEQPNHNYMQQNTLRGERRVYVNLRQQISHTQGKGKDKGKN
jgi:hypothetical protein